MEALDPQNVLRHEMLPFIGVFGFSFVRLALGVCKQLEQVRKNSLEIVAQVNAIQRIEHVLLPVRGAKLIEIRTL